MKLFIRKSDPGPHGPLTHTDRSAAIPGVAGVLPEWILRTIWAVLVVLGIVCAWCGRNNMNPDGMSYIDIADAYSRGEWWTAISTYWSPLYSWIIAAFFRLWHPTPEWEFPAVHLLNFGIYLCALWSFHFFWRTRNGYRDVFWTLFGYALFAWSTLYLVTLDTVTPDLLVVALVFVAAGLFMRECRSPNIADTVLLGLVLALAYLAKAAMFPIALAGLFVAFCVSRSIRITAAVTAAFLLFCAPWIIVLSKKAHRLTTSDAGVLNYNWYVQGSSHFPYSYAHADPALYSIAATAVSESPAIFEFHGPDAATYQIWFDPRRWYVPHLRVSLHDELRRAGKACSFFWKFMTGVHPDYAVESGRSESAVLLAGLLPLLGMLRRVRRPSRNEVLLGFWAVSAFLIYAAVHLEIRFVAAFAVFFWLLLYSPYEHLKWKHVSHSILTVVSATLVVAAVSPVPTMLGEIASDVRARRIGGTAYETAKGLLASGLRPHDAIASIGYSSSSYYARLARMHFVAEIGDEDVDLFWSQSDAERNRTYELLARTGAKALVAANVALGNRAGWRNIPGTPYYYHPLMYAERGPTNTAGFSGAFSQPPAHP